MKTINLGPIFYTNCYIEESIINNNCFIVDPGSNIDLIKENINLDVSFILLTHGHSDHIDSIGYFNCPIYIHELDYEKLFNDDLSLYSSWGEKKSFDPKKLDIRIIKDNDEIIFNNEKIKIIHTPGHTSGSVCYLYKSKLYSGDTLFNSSIGRTDFPTGDSNKMRNSLIKIIDNLDDQIKVYPGHGEKTTIKDERQNNEYYKYYKKISKN